MKIATLGFSLLLGASPSLVHADITGSVDIRLSASLPGVEIHSVDVFYDQLSPHGVWVDESRAGRVFIPDEDGYIPYRDGHWAYTDVGMVWIAAEPFGWATSHYGRWFFSSEFGRWVWVPDTEWGPSWVEWYEAEDTFGWVPMPPEIVLSYGYETPMDAWHYCPSSHLFDRDLERYYVPRDRVRTLHTQARPVAQRAAVGGRTIVRGPAPERLAAHRINVQRQPIQRVAPPRQIGRPTPTEAQRLVQRAQQRRPVVEQQNTRRIQQRPEIRRIVEQRPARTAPAAPTAPSRTAPAPTGGREVRPTAPTPRGDAARPPQPTPRDNTDAGRAPTPPRATPPRDHTPTPPRATPPRGNRGAGRAPAEPPRVAPPQRPNEPPPRVAPPQRPDQPPPRVAPPQRPPQAPPRAERAPEPPRAQPQPPRAERDQTPRAQPPRDDRKPARRPPARDKDKPRDDRK